MPAKENQPSFKEYPEPEFPDEQARDAYRRAREIIHRAWDLGRAGNPVTNLSGEFNYLELPAFPREVGNLPKLKVLHITHSNLRELPPEIGQLTTLTDLNLSQNRLKALPPEIGQLKALTKLHVSNNELKVLPTEVGQMKRLTELYLSNNKLTALPPEIGLLTALTELNLHDNQLMTLPPEFGQLKALVWLNLSNNLLTVLPPVIGQLGRLQWLQLAQNQLKGLPESMRGLPSLRGISVHDNPALELPPEVLGTDPRESGLIEINCPALLDYYFSMQKGARPLNEVKLLLLGRGGAGKTATMNRLLGRGFIPETAETQGIDITDFDMTCPEGQTVVVPVILERCHWTAFKELASLQALPKDAKPLREWKPTRNVAWFHVMEALQEKIKKMQQGRKQGRCLPSRLHFSAACSLCISSRFVRSRARVRVTSMMALARRG